MASQLGIAWHSFLRRPWWRKVADILLVVFAAAGAAIIGAWALYQLGVTNNGGRVDANNRSLAAVSEIDRNAAATQDEIDAQWALQYGRMSALARFYPYNAHLILRAAQHSNNPAVVDRMITAAGMYMDDDSEWEALSDRISDIINATPQRQRGNIIPWMERPEWLALKEAICSDSALINEAGRLTGVEPRLIVGCLIGEQMRLMNSDRENIKKFLGPVKMLGVQSQFSYGVNGIKDKTAIAVEEHLKDPTSEFYMGHAYEHLLDFTTDDHTAERYNRLVDYKNHLYSYIYTACILHQTMLQWRRAGYDISDRPEVLFTLFNLGFKRSKPHPNPEAGGSSIRIGDRKYTFSALGFDFYYSGEMADIFPFHARCFHDADEALSPDDIARIQSNMSDCDRPERGLEYRRDSVQSNLPDDGFTTPPPPPDPFGINPEAVVPVSHTAQ